MLAKNVLAKNRRRDSILILADILSYADRGIRRTELTFKAKLSSAQWKKYLPLLMRSGLLETFQCNKRLVYRTTLKGKDFLEISDMLLELLS